MLALTAQSIGWAIGAGLIVLAVALAIVTVAIVLGADIEGFDG